MIDTSPSLALVLLVGVLVGTGVYLLLERSLTRIVVGIALISNGVNVLFLIAGGRAGAPPIIGAAAPEDMSDPLPQAMILTAIVITLGMTAFLLAMAYRSWQLNGHDEVQDDLEDRRIARRAERNELPARSTDDAGTSLAEDAASVRDETASEDEHAPRGHHRPAMGADDGEALR
ncbi:Na(+)/H(+) antiporter subunit C [Georgenia faecalis]|uniref:Na(+)/H(+) antiporter subunit C n=1 Tax=Georgenia faecalis TaxID=2483799 RepID=A0ABV9D7M1_9MICO|nr:Na(+)/H(+) antiporter subunit C [Georgenia faecalis]